MPYIDGEILQVGKAKNTRAIYLNNHRITETKPYGNIYIIDTYRVSKDQILEALDIPNDYRKSVWQPTSCGDAVCCACGKISYRVIYDNGWQPYCGQCGYQMTGIKEIEK